MEKGFLSPKGRGSGKNVKEKQSYSVHNLSKALNSFNTKYGSSTNVTMNLEHFYQ